MDNTEYEEATKKIITKNKKYLKVFETELGLQQLNDKTIQRHMSNVTFYINEYLCYYFPQTIEDGCYNISDFLGYWCSRKGIYLSKDVINKYCSSLKKFYITMLHFNFIKEEDYKTLIRIIKEEKEEWIIQAEEDNYQILNN